jgi:hypothetical protein
MWRRCVLGFGVLVACSTTAAVERHYLPNGTWQLTCQLPMAACIRAFETNCPGKRYRILSGVSRRELRDVEPAVKETFTTELTAVCDADGMVMKVETPTTAGAPAAAAGSAPATIGGPACLPGATQTCIGPGGCPGGQGCRADGAGFTSCDCGTVTAGGDAGR